jgi:hypothetical protein
VVFAAVAQPLSDYANNNVSDEPYRNKGEAQKWHIPCSEKERAQPERGAGSANHTDENENEFIK